MIVVGYRLIIETPVIDAFSSEISCQVVRYQNGNEESDNSAYQVKILLYLTAAEQGLQ